jgi:hypothetical protein
MEDTMIVGIMILTLAWIGARLNIVVEEVAHAHLVEIHAYATLVME